VKRRRGINICNTTTSPIIFWQRPPQKLSATGKPGTQTAMAPDQRRFACAQGISKTIDHTGWDRNPSIATASSNSGRGSAPVEIRPDQPMGNKIVAHVEICEPTN
jgi:hypothetical protein